LKYIIVGGPGWASLVWLVYDKFIAKPKLEAQVVNIGTRCVFTPESWNWFKDGEERAWCRPYGVIVRVPVINNGRKSAVNCKAKMRFRLETFKGGRWDFGEWSDYRELHWSENPETNVVTAYKLVIIGRKE